MKIGDLVRVNQDIHEYTAMIGETVGMLISCDQQVIPTLFEVLWPNGKIESLYSDELEPIIEGR